MPQNEEDYEALARDTILDPEPEDEVKDQAAAGKTRGKRRVQRLQPLPPPFVRIPLQWVLKPHRPCLFNAKARVFMALLEDSRGGQREVQMNDPTIASLQIPERTKQWGVARLLRDGWIRVEYGGPGHALTVTVLVHSG
jgi:hypothetical protein